MLNNDIIIVIIGKFRYSASFIKEIKDQNIELLLQPSYA